MPKYPLKRASIVEILGPPPTPSEIEADLDEGRDPILEELLLPEPDQFSTGLPR